MGLTLIEKIISAHSDRTCKPGDIVDMEIDARLARDFGGANVVKNLEEHGLGIDDPGRTFFTLDCNPTGSDQRYAANQQRIRVFARAHGIKVYDINAGIGTHIAIDEGLVGCGGTLVSTDSHANILGAVGAFGQGMGDQDIAYAFAAGRVWFRVPPTLRILVEGRTPEGITAKDITLELLRKLGARGLLGYAAEIYGEAVDEMSVSDRVTVASMATEMGGIIILFPPTRDTVEELRMITGKTYDMVEADEGASYEKDIRIDVSKVEPLISLPGNPEKAVPVREVLGTRIDSAFIGSCTDGRYEDMRMAADILTGRTVAPGVVLKIVPATDSIWKRCLDEGIVDIFKRAGALVANAGCAGCAAGQVGQNGPGEVTVSTGNRNFPGKQGQGHVYLASPAVVAASAVAGFISTPDKIDAGVAPGQREAVPPGKVAPGKGARPGGGAVAAGAGGRAGAAGGARGEPPTVVRGRVWKVEEDNIDTDMIYHNRHLAVTDIGEMGQYCFGNLGGWEDFPKKARAGDIVITGENFGAGSSRQHAVDCFKSLGVSAVIAKSFGAIYERNAINAALPIVTGDLSVLNLKDGDIVTVDFVKGEAMSEATGAKVPVKVYPVGKRSLATRRLGKIPYRF
jgi:homoaconitate hydratase family protein/3-isopropylmalate dehydratase small subunit